MNEEYLAQEEALEICDGFIKITVNSIESGYRITYNADGTGEIFSYEYDDDFATFDHSLNLPKVQLETPDTASLQSYLADHFWREINPKLEEPIIQNESELEDYELEFVLGNPMEFDRLMHLFILTEPDIEKENKLEVIVEAAAPEHTYSIWEHDHRYIPTEPCLSEWGYRSNRLTNLLDLAVKEHRPYGYSYDYNEQAYDLRSGYRLSPSNIVYDLNEVLRKPAREKMAARQELADWLKERGQNPADFGLDWEKIL